MTDVEQYIIDTYGPILSADDLAIIFKYKNARSVGEAISRETFPDTSAPLKTMRKGSRRVANFRDVASYIEKNYGIIQPCQPD